MLVVVRGMQKRGLLIDQVDRCVDLVLVHLSTEVFRSYPDGKENPSHTPIKLNIVE